MKRASRRLGGGFRRASEGFKGASERFEGGFEQGSKGARERLLRGLRRLITCASNRSLAPPIAAPSLLTCAPLPAFHNAML